MVTNNSTKLNEIENNINNTTQTLSTINSNVSTVSNGVNSNSSKLDTLTSNVSSVSTKVNSNGSKLDQLISSSGSSSGAVKSVQRGYLRVGGSPIPRPSKITLSSVNVNKCFVDVKAVSFHSNFECPGYNYQPKITLSSNQLTLDDTGLMGEGYFLVIHSLLTGK